MALDEPRFSTSAAALDESRTSRPAVASERSRATTRGIVSKNSRATRRSVVPKQHRVSIPPLASPELAQRVNVAETDVLASPELSPTEDQNIETLLKPGVAEKPPLNWVASLTRDQRQRWNRGGILEPQYYMDSSGNCWTLIFNSSLIVPFQATSHWSRSTRIPWPS